MYFQLTILSIILSISLCWTVSITVLQNVFCINCKQLIQESKKNKRCDSSNKYKNSLDETMEMIHCSHVNQCYEMCNQRWKYYKHS